MNSSLIHFPLNTRKNNSILSIFRHSSNLQRHVKQVAQPFYKQTTSCFSSYTMHTCIFNIFTAFITSFFIFFSWQQCLKYVSISLFDIPISFPYKSLKHSLQNSPISVTLHLLCLFSLSCCFIWLHFLKLLLFSRYTRDNIFIIFFSIFSFSVSNFHHFTKLPFLFLPLLYKHLCSTL